MLEMSSLHFFDIAIQKFYMSPTKVFMTSSSLPDLQIAVALSLHLKFKYRFRKYILICFCLLIKSSHLICLIISSNTASPRLLRQSCPKM